MFLIIAALSCCLFLFAEAYKGNLQIFTEEYPPLTFAVGEEVSGYATDIVRELMKVLGTKHPIKLLTWESAYQRALKEENTVIYTIERTPLREKNFQWVGPLGENSAGFYVKAESKLKITKLEDAKKLGSIAIVSNWFAEQQLLDLGFKNLIPTASHEESIQMVASGKANAVLLTDITAKSLIKDAGLKPDSLIRAFTFSSTQYYIGFSLSTKKEIVKAWSKAFEVLEETGVLAELKSKWMKEN
jgi:polar amino acid transport system substrate-binding protein